MAKKTINMEGRDPTAEEMGGIMLCMKVAEVMGADSVLIVADDGDDVRINMLIHPDKAERISIIADAMESCAEKLRAQIPKVAEALAEHEAEQVKLAGGLH